MPIDKMAELIERVERASGPDREIDLAIARVMGTIVLQRNFSDTGNHETTHWEYTASIDAAMTLVPEGWKLRQMNFSAPCADDRKWHLSLYGGSVGEDCFVGRGATPALALCAAALKARTPAATSEREG